MRRIHHSRPTPSQTNCYRLDGRFETTRRCFRNGPRMGYSNRPSMSALGSSIRRLHTLPRSGIPVAILFTTRLLRLPSPRRQGHSLFTRWLFLVQDANSKRTNDPYGSSLWTWPKQLNSLGYVGRYFWRNEE